MTLQQQLESGMSHHRAGRLAEAQEIYRRVLALQPNHPDALHRLGMLMDHTGRPDAAVELIQRAIQLRPNLPGAHSNLGNALANAGRIDEAIASHRTALRLDPNSAEAQNNLGAVLANAGQLEEAISLFQRAIGRRPDFSEAHVNLGDALAGAGKLDEAIAAYRQAIRLRPDHFQAYDDLGNALQRKEQFDEAIATHRRAIQLKPDFAEAHNNLGNALRSNGQSDEAAASLQQAIRLKPDYALAYYNLGNVLKDNRRLDEAIALYRQAIQLQPDLAAAHCNLGGALQDIGRIDDALISYRQACRHWHGFAGVHSNLLFALNYQQDGDAGEILAEHEAWADRYARPLTDTVSPHANERSPERKLRIGYVSADFWRHSVGRFFLSLLVHHDRQNFELFCYANAVGSDDMTDRIKRSCDGWRNIVGMTDEAVAQMVRADGIDILVDLSGHTNGNRLLVFARKPAPIQVTYLGYPNTTGMQAIDYRFTDALADPPGMTDHLNTEKLWRLPLCAWCFQPPHDAPEIQPREDGPVTFGCFNGFSKINPKLTAIWANLLKKVPGSRLRLKSAGAGEASSRQRLTGQFAEHGIPEERIEMFGWIADARRHLELYQQIDVALDTYPYHGTTTTCEALWMGVPVVSLAGRTHVSRVGVSLLNCVGLPELVADTPEEYVSIASDLATDPTRLNALRRNLRNNMSSSPLMDGARFAAGVEAAYRQMWRKWCAERGSDRPTLQQHLESAVSHHRAGRLTEADGIYRQILAIDPDNVEALHLQGTLASQMGQQEAALELIGRAIRLKPDLAVAHNNLGKILRDMGRTNEAIAAFQEAVRLKPDYAQAYSNLGSALGDNGQHDEAIAACRQAILINPAYAEAYVNLGNSLEYKGQTDEAIANYRQAIRLKPDLAGAHSNLGNALSGKGQLDEAIAFHRQAVGLNPDLAEAQLNLGLALEGAGRFEEAIAADRQAICLKPDYAEAHCSLGNALRAIGQFEEAISSYRQAIQLNLDSVELRSGLIFALNYQPDGDAGEILAEHRDWADRYAQPLMNEIRPHINEHSPERRLRIGYVSGDFGRHVVSQFFIPLLDHHDRRLVEVFCYANVKHPDEVTDRIRRSCDAWRNIVGLTDEAVAQMVRTDEIDILMDLSGHTSGNRLLVFAHKPAPIQVTYLGYPNTTGMQAIDYRFSDALADPPGMTDHLNAEKLWRLPVCAWCFQPPNDAPDIQPRGDGPITFGCFNAFSKINPKLTAIWANLLKRVPGSRLLLKSAGAGEISSRQRLTTQFAEHGIPGERIEMIGRIANARRHLELYRRVDVALDTFPYHGTTTTCEALWMGVPVVSLAGRTHVSRVGVSLLNCVGLPELVADTPEEYVSIASELATDSTRLNALRGSLRKNMSSSPLMDGARFAAGVEAAYRQMWRKWCAAGDT
jgi:predicted O-linked N-acetylglucosamine transferase (SPINDLY family)